MRLRDLLCSCAAPSASVDGAGDCKSPSPVATGRHSGALNGASSEMQGRMGAVRGVQHKKGKGDPHAPSGATCSNLVAGAPAAGQDSAQTGVADAAAVEIELGAHQQRQQQATGEAAAHESAVPTDPRLSG